MWLLLSYRTRGFSNNRTRGFPNAANAKLLRSFILCQSWIIVWLVGQLLEVNANTLLEQTIAINFTYLATVWFLGPSLLLFSLNFTRRNLPPLIKGLLFVPGAIFYGILVTNREFYFSRFELGLYEKAAGFFIAIGSVYLYVAVSLLLILLRSRKAYPKKRRQMGLIGLVVALPFGVHVLSMVFSQTDYTPYAFSVSAVLILVAIAKYEFMNVIPAALNEIVYGLDDPIIVADHQEEIIFINEAAAALFPPCEEIQPVKIGTKTMAIRSTYLVLAVGTTYRINTVISPKEADQEVEYRSTTQDVISVTQDGLIKALKPGNGSIIVSNWDKPFTLRGH